MKQIKLKNKELNEQYRFVINNYYKQLPQEHKFFVKTVVINFKRDSNNEELILLILYYGLIFFGSIDINDDMISDTNREKILLLQKYFQYEVNGETELLLNEIIDLDKELFHLRMVIKYSVIQFEDIYDKNIIQNKDNYYKSIGYLIPYLTFTESKMLTFFQDTYFKKIYPDQYEQTVSIYENKLKQTGIEGECIINVSNYLSEVLKQWNIPGYIKIRKKSYFSIYNKLKRKEGEQLIDTIGMRIIFHNLEDLRKYQSLFENKFLFSKKKDYINQPKKNGYQSLHYNFITVHDHNEVQVELQLRTLDMDNRIRNAKEISHYNYTIKENKWNHIFEEVHIGKQVLSSQIA